MNLAFVFSIISIMPIAFLMGKATEEIAHYYSQSIGVHQRNIRKCG